MSAYHDWCVRTDERLQRHVPAAHRALERCVAWVARRLPGVGT